MNWTDLRDFLDMGGYGLYVWGSMGMTAAVVVAELLLLRLRRRLLVREASDTQAIGERAA
ncbi:MAG: heme exporter protein CcmD [Hydrogenophaga sp.]|uniref:heme exporter protein CcmD n=1 Tax=Hydrogenophaga sp. TaxID=1904254 RepID=UPI003D0D06D9